MPESIVPPLGSVAGVRLLERILGHELVVTRRLTFWRSVTWAFPVLAAGSTSTADKARTSYLLVQRCVRIRLHNHQVPGIAGTRPFLGSIRIALRVQRGTNDRLELKDRKHV